MDEKTQALFNFVMGDLFNATLEKDLLVFSAVHECFILDGQVLTPAATQEIIDGAKICKQMAFFEYMLRDFEHDAKMRMFNKQKVMEDANFGKAVLYVIDLMRKKVAEVSKMELKNKPQEPAAPDTEKKDE